MGGLRRTLYFSYFRLVLTLAILLFTSRQVLAVLGVEDYGIYNVVAGAIVMLSFLNGAMTAGTQRFLAFELGAGRNEEIRNVFNAALVLHLAIAAIVIILAETVGIWLLHNVLTIPEDRRSAAYWVFQFAVLAFVFNIIQVPYMATIVAHERMGIYAYLSIFEVSIKLGNVFILMFVDFDKLVLYGILNACANLVIVAVYVGICRKHFPESRIAIRSSLSKIREMSEFLGWNAFASMAVAAGVQGVNVLLNVFFGPVVNAARGVAMLASESIKQFANAFQIAAAPQITKTYSGGEFEEQKTLILFACKSTLFLMLLVALPIFMETEAILGLWLKDPPVDSALFLRLIICDALICSSANPMYYAIMATGNIKGYQLMGAIINMCNFSCCWMILSLGAPAYSVFCVLIVVSVLMLVLRLEFLRRMISFSAGEYVRAVVIPGVRVVVASASLPLIALWYLAAGLPRLLAVGLLGLCCTVSAIYLLGLNVGERTFVREKVIAGFARLRG